MTSTAKLILDLIILFDFHIIQSKLSWTPLEGNSYLDDQYEVSNANWNSDLIRYQLIKLKEHSLNALRPEKSKKYILIVHAYVSRIAQNVKLGIFEVWNFGLQISLFSAIMKIFWPMGWYRIFNMLKRKPEPQGIKWRKKSGLLYSLRQENPHSTRNLT